MFRRARELGPPFLVPLAWLVVAGAHLDTVGRDAILVAHVVMAVALAGFVGTGRADMRTGVLAHWWRLIAAGFLVTLVGVAGFLAGSDVLLAVALFGWMLLPAAGFLVTGRRVPEGASIYAGGAAGCLVGVLSYAAGLTVAGDAVLVAGVALVGLGQTAGILDAALRY